MKIQHRLIAGFAGIALLMQATWYVAGVTHRTIRNEVRQMITESVKDSEYASEMLRALRASRCACQELIAARHSAETPSDRTEKAEKRIRYELAAFEKHLSLSRKATRTAAQPAADAREGGDEKEAGAARFQWPDQIAPLFSRYNTAVLELLSLVRTDLKAADARLETTIGPYYEKKLLPLISRYENAARSELARRAAHIAYNADRTDTFLLIFGIISLAVVVVTGGLISRAVLRPVRQMTARLSAWEKGEAGPESPFVSSDEMGVLAAHISRMADRLKDLEVSLRHSQQTAELANRTKSEFLANMSHELRTPLNHIIGFAELTVDKKFGEINDIQEDYLNEVVNSGRHLLSLVNDILDISRVEAGKLELDLSDISLKAVLEESTVLIREKALKHGIKLVMHIENGLETIRADRRKLKQIMYNILSNAVKFTPDGGNIEIISKIFSQTEEQADTGPASVEICVADTGIGLEEKDLDHIFDPFVQADNTGHFRHEGAGLGLSLTRQFVEMHGGRIWAESAGRGRGSIFRFTLPCSPDA